MATPFVFGAPTVSTTPSGPLFGNAPKLSFAAPSAAPSTTSAPGLFGTTTTSSAPATSLFGSPSVTKTTAASGAGGTLFTGPTASASAPSLSVFGSATTSSGLLGSTAAASTAAAGGGLFAQTSMTTATTSSTTSSGLGGTGNFALGGSMGSGAASGSAVGVTGLAASGNPMEGEVPKQILDLVTQLKEQVKTNKEKSDEFAMNSSDACMRIDEKLDVIKKLRVHHYSELRHAVQKVNALLKRSERDVYAGEQLARRQKEAGKNPHYGQSLAMEYLQATCAEYEKNLVELAGKLQRLEEIISQRRGDQNGSQMSKQDLMKLLERFDEIFKSVASEVYEYNQQVQDVKDAFLELRKATLPYAPNPFAKKADQERISKLARFSGADAFPSQITMMKIGELARVATPGTNPIGTTASSFGATGSLFGPKPLGTTPFSFNTTTTTGSLFKPFNAPAASTAPLFGAPKTTSTAASTAAPSFTFGNTLNSTASGTLFGGSASKPFGK